MCILFVYLGLKQCGDSEELIISSNRDEFFSRVTSSTDLRSKYNVNVDYGLCDDGFKLKHDMERAKHQQKDDKKEMDEDDTIVSPLDTSLSSSSTSATPIYNGGSWFAIHPTTRRWAIVTNVRRHTGYFDFLDDPMFFSRLFLFCAVLCLIGYAVLLKVRYKSITSEIDNGESGVHTFLINKLTSNSTNTPNPVTNFLLQTLPYLLSVQTLPILIPAVLSYITSRILSSLPYNTSRGHLVTSFVSGSTLSPHDFCINFTGKNKGLEYSGFNLICGIGNDAYHISNRPTANVGGLELCDDGGGSCFVTQLEMGRVYGVSNGGLDEDWDKVESGRALFCTAVRNLGCRGTYNFGLSPNPTFHRSTAASTLIKTVMGNTEQRIPAITGCPYHVEKKLAFIRVPAVRGPNGSGKIDAYGTRTTIVCFVGWEVKEDGEDGEDGESNGYEKSRFTSKFHEGIEVWECEYNVKEGGVSGNGEGKVGDGIEAERGEVRKIC